MTDDRAPMAFSITRQIARPVDEVFAFLEDFTNVPTWNHWVREVRQVTPGPIGVGTVFHQVRRDDEQRYRITAHRPPHELVVTTIDGSSPAFTRAMILRHAGDGTSLLDRWRLDTGHPRALQRMAVHRTRDAITTNLDSLVELLEAGRTILPDGRRVETATPPPGLATP